MSQKISRRNLERSLEELMDDGETNITMVPRSFTTNSMVSEPDSKIDVTECDAGTFVENAQGLTLKYVWRNTNSC